MQGNAHAQFLLGLSCHFGLGLTQDRDAAADWYLKAAQQHHGVAQLQVASLFGKEGQFENAYFWYSLASNNLRETDPENAESAAEGKKQAAQQLDQETLQRIEDDVAQIWERATHTS